MEKARGRAPAATRLASATTREAWEKDLRHGKGISRYEDGSRFEGEYRDDWRYYGTYWLSNGDVYVGYFGEHGGTVKVRVTMLIVVNTRASGRTT